MTRPRSYFGAEIEASGRVDSPTPLFDVPVPVHSGSRDTERAAAIWGWIPALWTAGGLTVASIIRFAGR